MFCKLLAIWLAVNTVGLVRVNGQQIERKQGVTQGSAQLDAVCPPNLLAPLEIPSNTAELRDEVVARLQRICDYLESHPDLGLILGVCEASGDDSQRAQMHEKTIRQFLVAQSARLGGSVTADRIFARSDLGSCFTTQVCEVPGRVIPLVFALQDGEAGQLRAIKQFEHRCELQEVFNKPPDNR